MPDKTTQAPEWITREDAAALLGVHVRTVDRRISEGAIKTKRPRVIRGRNAPRLLVKRSDVEALAAEDAEQ